MNQSPKSVLVLNGPNLNLLGRREPTIYGSQTLADVEKLCMQTCLKHGFTLDFRQTNSEGDLVGWIHQAADVQNQGLLARVILNAAAYTHTSVALHDAIKAASVHLIELHISNVHARENFRQHSYISPVADGVMFGFGINGYALAITALALR